MTNYEFLKRANLNCMADTLCNLMGCSEVDCKNCIASDHCSHGHTGFIEWLKEEAEISRHASMCDDYIPVSAIKEFSDNLEGRFFDVDVHKKQGFKELLEWWGEKNEP